MEKRGKNNRGMTSASLIDLKAELFRKQEEFKQQKLQSENSGFIKGKPSTSNTRPSLFSKRNTGVLKRAERDYEEKVEEENVFERSKISLEKKARLYEKISSGAELPEEDGSGMFLVDFQKKVLDDVAEKREKKKLEKERRDREEREEEEERRLQAEPVAEPETEDEQWVDYVDAFGRSRRCLRKDLPALKQQDEVLHKKKRDKSESVPSLLSDDMAREMERQRWEQKELEQMKVEKEGPIHYTDVRYNEVRTHGVGFYQFDEEEASRQAQMDQLDQLRQQTKDERSKSERIKDKRKAALAARLAKVKQRKREKLGLTADEEEEVANSSSEEDVGLNLSEAAKQIAEPLTRDDSWCTKTPTTREWDKGKHVSMEASEQAWLERQRAERDKEFAPPTFYYDPPTTKQGSKIMSRLETSTKTPGLSMPGGTKKTKETSKSFSAAAVNDTPVNDTPVNDTPVSDTTGVTIIGKLIGDQIHQIRETVESAGDIDIVEKVNLNTHSTRNMIPNQSQKPVTGLNTNVQTLQTCPQDVSSVSQNTVLSPMYIPLPNMNIPPPDVNYPPPNLNIYTPNLLNQQQPIHQTNVSVPTPNLQVPPPNLNMPPPGFYPCVNITSTEMPVSNIQSNVPEYSQLTSANVTHPMNITPVSVAPNVPEVSVKKVIPKLSIIDTRLMESE